MRKQLLSIVLLSLATSLSVAQSATPESVCEVHVNKVKPGMTAQYERYTAPTAK